MPYNPDVHHRQSIRLRGYDYSQPGAYFITICTHNRACLFGEIANGKMVLNDVGKIVADEWMKSGEIRKEIELDEWVIMPNHFHGIVMICRGDRLVAPTNRPVAPTNRPVAPTNRPVAPTNRPVAPALPGPHPKSIGALMSGFKSAVTKRINQMRGTPGAKLWQRNYWERIIRDENELNRIREYIINNPLNWHDDEHYI